MLRTAPRQPGRLFAADRRGAVEEAEVTRRVQAGQPATAMRAKASFTSLFMTRAQRLWRQVQCRNVAMSALEGARQAASSGTR